MVVLDRMRGTGLALALLAAVNTVPVGCTENYIAEDRTDHALRELKMTQHEGGTHHLGLMHDGTWFVSQGVTVLAIDPRTGKTRSTEVVAPEGTTGPITDMAIWQDNLMVVLDESAVVRFEFKSSGGLTKLESLDTKALGVLPKRLSIIGEALYVSGRGGVVQLPGMQRFLVDQEQIGAVAPSEGGPVAIADRRVLSLQTGEYVGAATHLAPLPESLGISGGLLFVLQGREGATVGLMGPDVREISSSAVAGWVRRARLLGTRLFAVTDTEIASWDVSGGTLEHPIVIRLKGGRDIDAINDNYFVVVGSFGRAVLRLDDDATGAGDEFLRVTRVPGRLDLALTDQRTVIGSSLEGTWSYPVRGKATLTDRKISIWGVPARTVTAYWGTAKLVGGDSTESDQHVEISSGTGGTKGEWRAPLKSRIWVLSVVDGDLWIGHDRGISVLRQGEILASGGGAFPVKPLPAEGTSTPTCPLTEIASLRLEGPVIMISPLRTGQGASWVSRWGGFGVGEWLADGKASRSKPLSTSADTSSP